MPPAVRLALHCHTDAAVWSLRGIQPQEVDGALPKLVMAVYKRVLALTAAGAPAGKMQAVMVGCVLVQKHDLRFDAGCCRSAAKSVNVKQAMAKNTSLIK
jgi:hypothetical protein